MGKKKKGTEIDLPVESSRPHRPTISTHREKVNHLSKWKSGRNRNARFKPSIPLRHRFPGPGHIFLQRRSQVPGYRNHWLACRAESSVRLISVQIPQSPTNRIQFLAPKFWQAWGCITTSVMISEVLFGYFLFKEKVTDAPTLKQVASLLPEQTMLLPLSQPTDV